MSDLNQHDDEPVGTIDDTLSTRDMLTLIRAETIQKRTAGHHIDSMNSFIEVGIKQIVTNVFTVEGRVKNKRDKTEEDRSISDITFKVDFKDINLTPPMTVIDKSMQPQMLTPNIARLCNLTYSAVIHVDAEINATAIYKDGTSKTVTSVIKDHRIGSIPCMVGSSLCHVNQDKCDRETRKALEEDPNDPGGYFIINGGEWTVDCLENLTNNTFHVHRNMYMNEIVRGQFLSKPGDHFENSYQVILRYLNNGAITLEITTTKANKFEIPYYLIFRALGMTRDRDIVNHICYGVDNRDTVTQYILEVLSRAFEVSDKSFDPVRQSTDSTEIIQFIAKRITEGANTIAAQKDDNIAKYLNNVFLNLVDRYIFPHIGTGVEHRIIKLRFLGHLINKLIRVEMGEIPETSRDSLARKRVIPAGYGLGKTFKTDFNFAIVQEIKKRIIKDLKYTPFSQVHLAESAKDATATDNLEKWLIQAITTGNKTITVKRNEITNRIASQTLQRKNDVNVISTLNSVNAPNATASKQNERADEMRRVHHAQIGYYDVSQSPDTGEGVGMDKQLGCMASVCGATSSYELTRKLLRDGHIIRLESVEPEMITCDKLTKVFVNGGWIGCCQRGHDVVAHYRHARRHGEIHHLTTIVWELLIREIYFWVDFGRLQRPLIIVYNNLKAYVKAWRSGDRSVQFKQWIKLTRDHIDGLRRGLISMNDLRVARVIEYIAPEEQENAYIAENINVLRARSTDITHTYTHCDIEQAVLGLVTLACPRPNHSNTTRNTYYTNHRKQSAGWFCLSSPFRVDKGTVFQHYCERPLVSVLSDSITYPNGHNRIVALIIHDGNNIEDGIDSCKSSEELGSFNASYYTYERVELDKNEKFGNPDYARTIDIKKGAIYEFVENGIIREGTRVKKDYVLVVKSMKIPKPVDQYLYIDRSVVYKRDEPVIVERVIPPRKFGENKVVKVKMRADRPLIIGDKLSSRTGNKGIKTNSRSRCDMPYCEDGLTPDDLVNAHSIPSRMAINQLIECATGNLAAMRGAHIDATAFSDLDMDSIIDELRGHGIDYGGHRRMYNGKTGEWLDTLIFIGPTTYQRPEKFVKDEKYHIRWGPTAALTHQPLDGKSQDGGLRLGEMESWVLTGQGACRVMHNKLYEDSDGTDIYICRCGNRAIVNQKKNMYKCRTCGDKADITRVSSSWVANMFFNEMSAMNVKMKFDLEPYRSEEIL